MTRFIISMVTLLLQRCLLSNCNAANNDILLTRGITMSEGRYRIQWGFSGSSPEDTIMFQVQAMTLGWVGLGFSRNGGLAGADIVVAGFDEATGQGYLYDKHGKCTGFPDNDEHNNYNLISTLQNDSHTTVVLSRKLSTCDQEDHEITNDTVRLIWAMGETDSDSSDVFSEHLEGSINCGVQSTMLLDQGLGATTALPANTVQLDLTVSNVTIRADHKTMYWCKIIKLPMEWGTHHMIRSEPLIQKGNEKFLHHIVVYHCSQNMSEFVDKGEACFDRDYMESSRMTKCDRSVLCGWSVGSEGVQYKNDEGFPILEPGSSPYVLLDVHYDNSALHIAKQLDNSGIRLFLTPTLRPKELGSLILGISVAWDSIIIPPGQEVAKMYSKCDMTCTKHLPDGGIFITSARLHAHKTAVGIRLRHFRGHRELEPIVQDHQYDFTFQDERYFSEPRHVLPNDTLVVECTYNSLKRSNITYGGWGTHDEMCFVFVTYYPRITQLGSCISKPTHETYWNAMKSPPNKTGPEVNSPYFSLRHFAEKYDWIVENIEYFQQQIRNGYYNITCEGRQPINAGAQLGEPYGEKVFNHASSISLDLPDHPYLFPDFCSLEENRSAHRADNCQNADFNERQK